MNFAWEVQYGDVNNSQVWYGDDIEHIIEQIRDFNDPDQCVRDISLIRRDPTNDFNTERF